MDTHVLFVCMCILCVFDNYLCKGGSKRVHHAEKKKVIVIGGGMAGMAAARRLMHDGGFEVKVFEARRDRYGGRVWTNRNAVKKATGIDVELGAMSLNTRAANNTLHDLAKEFGLRTQTAGPVRVYFQEGDSNYHTLNGENVTKLYTEAFKIIIRGLQKVQKERKDKALFDIIQREIELFYSENESPEFDEVLIRALINSLPATLCEKFSSLLYEVDNEFGWDSVLVDGADMLVDGIVAGMGMELPVKVDLNKVVRNIAVDEKRDKVLVRTADRKQDIADAVIVALPIGVLKSDSVIFDPRLSGKWYKAIGELGLAFSGKVVVGFDEAFWPKDIGSFTVMSSAASPGFLQMWTNAYHVSDNPFLIGTMFGDQVKKWENAPSKLLKDKVKIILGDMFGAETVAAHKMTTFLFSNWSTDPLVMGSMSYPKVGSKTILWDILKRPACPYIYFAGAYTETQGYVETLHGAYNSGVRAAEQIINNVCHHEEGQKKKKRKMDGKSGDTKGKKNDKSETKDKKNSRKKKSVKDEL